MASSIILVLKSYIVAEQEVPETWKHKYRNPLEPSGGA